MDALLRSVEMKKVQFTKMHGAGNDFILIDDRKLQFPADDHVLLAALADHHTGISCEGIILLRPSERSGDFRMMFFNPDGTEADMCGNGARCAAAFARDCGAVKGSSMTMETGAGLVDAQILGPGLVKIWVNEPSNRRYDIEVALPDGPVKGDFVNSGVPHFVVNVESPSSVDVEGLGRRLRLAEEFAPDGANVDFVRYRKPNQAFLRTYERGVEAESGACGTGAIATAIVGIEKFGMSLPMTVRTPAGFSLTVDGDYRRSKSTGLTLTGPVKKVFVGEIDLDSIDIGNEME